MDVISKRIRKWLVHIEQYQFAIVFLITALAFIVRLFCFSFESRDYQIYLQPWVEEIRQNGGFLSIGKPIGDYLPTYIYILSALSYIPGSSLIPIKIIFCIGDVVLAYFASRIVKSTTKNRSLAVVTYSIVMLLPTVILNSALWGQCDSLYVSALVASVYYMMVKKPNAGMIAFSIAFVFKPQAVFLAPLILLLVIEKQIRFRHLLYIPAIYFLAILPAWIAGREFSELLTVYTRLAGSYQRLTLNAPNHYTFFNQEDTTNIANRCLAVVVFVLLLSFKKLWETKFILSSNTNL